MGNWAQVSDVQARVPGRPITDTSKPNIAQVSAWIDEAEAELSGSLAAIGLVTALSANAITILKSWVCDFAEGHVRRAHASAGGDGNNVDGKDLLERWQKRLDDLFANPSRYGSVLTANNAPAETVFVRGPREESQPPVQFAMGEVEY